MIAGTGGDCGKTLVSLSLLAYWRSKRFAAAAFKKGPDYIDAAWLRWASGSPARNLDTYIVDRRKVHQSFFLNSAGKDIALIEGNRGLHDGLNVDGTHSSAELAKLLETPVVLVVNAAKVTRTIAALVLGCQRMDPEVKIAGVIFNRAAGERHRNLLRKSVEQYCGLPTLGFIPRIENENFLPGRHLGLVTPEEHPKIESLHSVLAQIAEKHLYAEQILEIARGAPQPESPPEPIMRRISAEKIRARICYFYDSAFTFYYQENLEALQDAGAELIPISSLKSHALPECDGLFIGGGFPETHLRELSANESLRNSVKSAAEAGLPIYAECGGLIYLCRSLKWGGEEYPLADVFPMKLKVEPRPQGHGYCKVKVTGGNPYFPRGTVLKGHEFHYTKVIEGQEEVRTVFQVLRGTGCFDRRDGVIYKNVLAGYLHIHALGVPEWGERFVDAAERFHNIHNIQ